jgi:hypothetical protein
MLHDYRCENLAPLVSVIQLSHSDLLMASLNSPQIKCKDCGVFSRKGSECHLVLLQLHHPIAKHFSKMTRKFGLVVMFVLDKRFCGLLTAILTFNSEMEMVITKGVKKTNSVALSPRANYTD